MIKAIFGRKLGMSQIFEEDGVVPVTLVEAKPCVIVQKKTKKKDGYNAIQLGFGELKENKATKPQLGNFKKSGLSPKRHLKEIKVENVDQIRIGDEIKINVFEKGDLVDVTGISKGKGFQGVVKRYGFKGGPASHGAKHWHRRSGSIGASADPSRVIKGKKMPGRMGTERITVCNLQVVGVNKEENLLLIKGGLPGKNGNWLLIKTAVTIDSTNLHE
ncbi:MAG: 50S ribosomal protein L3 [Candidatus Aerophobetes bacterium]|nr:50S ribosomal protein L3 [Candidatus Aerophobetes bacterium]